MGGSVLFKEKEQMVGGERLLTPLETGGGDR